MKKVLFFAVMFFLGLTSLCAQSSNDSIIVEKVTLGHKYSYHGQPVTRVKDMKAIVVNNDLALKEVKKGGVVNGFAVVLSCVGGAAVGWELGNMLYGKSNPYVLLGGLGVTAVGFGLSAWADSYLARGATLYNNSIGTTSFGDPVQLDFGLVPGGVGLSLRF